MSRLDARLAAEVDDGFQRGFGAAPVLVVVGADTTTGVHPRAMPSSIFPAVQNLLLAANALGYGSALSDYLGQAYMTQLLEVKPGQKVLEIGTGSGYQAAVLAELVKELYTIELVPALAEQAKDRLKRLSYSNVRTRTGDDIGRGWREMKLHRRR